VTASTNLNAVVFHPKYEAKLYFVLCGCLASLALSVFFIVWVGHREPMAFFSAAFWSFGLLHLWTICFSQIRFESKIIVDRFLLPSREFSYSDIVDVGLRSIKMTRGRIKLYPIKNMEELHGILADCARRGLVNEAALEGTEIVRELLSYIATAYSAVIAAVLAIGLALFCDVCGRVHGTLLALAMFLLVYGPVYYYLKRRSA
jgi:hypothetical protein